jgi:hypothetical protein
MIQQTLLVGVLMALGPAQVKEADSPIVANTRKKLDTHVTVEYKETRLQEVVDDLKKQVENLSISLDSAGGVSQNQQITYSATDKPLATVLDEMFKKAGLGYVIGKKKDKRYEGWLIIKKGNLRGDEEAATAKADKPPAKEKKPAKVQPPPEPKVEDTPEKAEQDAARKLRLAKTLEKEGVVDKAKIRYQEIVKKFPETKAAKEARELLDKLNK